MSAAGKDFELNDEGTIVQFRPMNPEALEWLQDDVLSQGWQWLGNSLCVQREAAGGLVDAIRENGFTLEI
jgi:hypothetical protein